MNNENEKNDFGYDLWQVEGNTVRTAVPAEKPRRRRAQPDRSTLREKRRRQLAMRRTERNRERALYMSPVYVMFLTMCTCTLFAICGIYIYLQSQSLTYVSDISGLESEVLNLKSDNDETELKINTTADLEEIKQRALGLGMDYPTSDQIIYYSTGDQDYMNSSR